MGGGIQRSKATTLGALCAVCLGLAAPGAFAQVQSKVDLLNRASSAAVLTAGNGIYTVHVENQCGDWTATTGPLHPAGAGLNVLYGNGSPGTSYTTLRSYTSGTDYVTGSGAGGCSALCNVAGVPSVSTETMGGTAVGITLTWTIVDAGNSVSFEQSVVVEGPVDGTETVDNTVIRETHTVSNAGPGSLSYGLRKLWDWQIGPDDGPWFGDCATPDQACDRSMNLDASGALDAPYPRSYVINDDPAAALCPGGIVPNNAAGCGGNPLYIVAGTVAPPVGLSPEPDAPEILQFNEWNSQFNNCWQPSLIDNALCGAVGFPSDDTAAAYFYGATAGTAEMLASGASKSFTQYVVAAEESCPEIIEPAIPTVSQWGLVVIALALLVGAKVHFRRRETT